METSNDILKLLSLSTTKEIRLETVKTLLALTGDEDGLNYLSDNTEFIPALVKLLEDHDSPEFSSSLQCLINMAIREKISHEIMVNNSTLVEETLQKILRGTATNLHCMLLCNLSHHENCSRLLQERFLSGKISLESVINSFLQSTPHSNYDHLASVLANLSRLPEVRKYLMNPEKNLFVQLLPFTTYADSHVRRIGIIRTLRNCCFETEYHTWLLNTAEVLPSLVLPLAGPEEFDEDEMEKLPLELQYLEPTKERDSDPEIRQLLLEILTLLCATKSGREFIRNKGIYVILRELHKWEKSRPVIVSCENLVDIIISDEPTPDMSNLLEVDVPEDMKKQFEKLNDELMNL